MKKEPNAIISRTQSIPLPTSEFIRLRAMIKKYGSQSREVKREAGYWGAQVHEQCLNIFIRSWGLSKSGAYFGGHEEEIKRRLEAPESYLFDHVRRFRTGGWWVYVVEPYHTWKFFDQISPVVQKKLSVEGYPVELIKAIGWDWHNPDCCIMALVCFPNGWLSKAKNDQ